MTALVRKNAPSYVRLDVDIKSDRPDLLPTEVVKQALFDYMEWAESVDPGAWAMLASDHYGRMVEPNHLQRSLDILETAALRARSGESTLAHASAIRHGANPDSCGRRRLARTSPVWKASTIVGR